MKGGQIVTTYRNEGLVLPESLRKEMKKLLHNGHLGVVKMEGRARETM